MKGLEDTASPLCFQACRVKGPFDKRQLREEEQAAAVCLKFKGYGC